MRALTLLTFLALLASAACDGRAVRSDAASSTTHLDGGYRPRDIGQGNDLLEPCGCKSGQIWKQGSCVPTRELGCGVPCDNYDGDPCSPYRRCDDCAASSHCGVDDCRGACVPRSAFDLAVVPLRISPTAGPLGGERLITIEGADFRFEEDSYRVRLWHLMALGQELTYITGVKLLDTSNASAGVGSLRFEPGSPPTLSWRDASAGAVFGPPVDISEVRLEGYRLSSYRPELFLHVYVEGPAHYPNEPFTESVIISHSHHAIEVESRPGSASCTLTVSHRFEFPGVYTVEVLADNARSDEWLLAGFYESTVGQPAATIQPGYACAAGERCARGLRYDCGCVSGRCECSR